MFNIGDDVQVRLRDTFTFAEYQRAGSRGVIVSIDHRDETILVEFKPNDRVWFRHWELESLNEDITTVGQAIDFLVKAGYKVTIEKE
jgi:hypothetical protein